VLDDCIHELSARHFGKKLYLFWGKSVSEVGLVRQEVASRDKKVADISLENLSER